MDEDNRKIYRGIVAYTTGRAGQCGLPDPVFEPEEVFDKCCLNLERQHLLAIESNDEFVQSCFLKILDKLSSQQWQKLASTPLKLGVVSREEFIDKLLNSREFTQNGTRFRLQDPPA